MLWPRETKKGKRNEKKNKEPEKVVFHYLDNALIKDNRNAAQHKNIIQTEGTFNVYI